MTDSAPAPATGRRPSWFELFYDLVIVAALVSVNDSFTTGPPTSALGWR